MRGDTVPIGENGPGMRTGRNGRIASLDAIRGIAILLVLLHHYITAPSAFEPGSLPDRIIGLISFGWSGVDLFFVLSGFLIGGIILRNGHEDGFLFGFYRRRAARLLPLYLVVVGLYAIVAPYLVAAYGERAAWLASTVGAPLWSHLFYLQNFFIAAHQSLGGNWLAPTWSLAIEEQFYLVAPLLLLTVPRRYLPATLILLIVIAPLCRVLALRWTGHFLPVYVLLPTRWDALAIGMLCAYAVDSARGRAWLMANPHWIKRALMTLGAMLATLQAFGVFAKSDLTFAMIGFTLIALFSLSLILAALFLDNGLSRALSRSTALINLGIISYGIYLIHMPVFGLVHLLYAHHDPRLSTFQDAGVVAAAAVITVGLAALSWRYFEAPILARSAAVRRGATGQLAPDAAGQTAA